MRKKICLTIVTVILSMPADAGLLEHFAGHYGALELYDERSKLSFRVNPGALSQPAPACSMAALDQALVALSAGQIKPESKLVWDEVKYPALPGWSTGWKRDQTLSTALKRQTPWFFESLALPAGKSTLASGKLQGKVAPLVAVEWMKLLKKSQLPYPITAQADLVRVLAKKNAPVGYKLVSFGTQCKVSDGLAQSWNIGYVDYPGGSVYFSVLVEGKNRRALFLKAPGIRDKSLIELKYWPAEG
jgi:beta-lactamase class D